MVSNITGYARSDVQKPIGAAVAVNSLTYRNKAELRTITSDPTACVAFRWSGMPSPHASTINRKR